MSTDLNIIVSSMNILSDPLIKKVFQNILKSRILSRYQLNEDLQGNQEQLETALASLQEAGLIDKKSGGEKDRDKFYPTGSGLNFEKIIK